ncbi:MAG: PCP reductase family protein [Dehalococcoidia bacterium]
MKFLCAKCDEPMKYKEASGPQDGSMSITFACIKCKNEVVLLTNPGETQLVRALDVKIGGMTSPHQPMELLRSSLAQQHPQAFSAEESTLSPEEPFWTNEAEQRLAKAPLFVREMVRKGTERYAKARGYREITPQVLDEAKQEMGPHSAV